MRKFTTLFLVALAMTIGASQAFAGPLSSNDVGQTGKPGRGGGSPNDDGGGGAGDDGGDPANSSNIARLIDCSPTHGNGCGVPPRPRKPKRLAVKKETEDCSCVHKVMRVNGRFMPFIDCYKSIEINGRNQLRYCTRDDES